MNLPYIEFNGDWRDNPFRSLAILVMGSVVSSFFAIHMLFFFMPERDSLIGISGIIEDVSFRDNGYIYYSVKTEKGVRTVLLTDLNNLWPEKTRVLKNSHVDFLVDKHNIMFSKTLWAWEMRDNIGTIVSYDQMYSTKQWPPAIYFLVSGALFIISMLCAGGSIYIGKSIIRRSNGVRFE